MLTLTNQEVREIKKIIIVQRKITLSKYLFIFFLFCQWVAVITRFISPTMYGAVLMGSLVSFIMYEVSMLRYNYTDYLLGIIQKYSFPGMLQKGQENMV